MLGFGPWWEKALEGVKLQRLGEPDIDPIPETVSEDPYCSFIHSLVPFLGSVGTLLNFEALDEIHDIGQGSELVSLSFYNIDSFFSISTIFPLYSSFLRMFILL